MPSRPLMWFRADLRTLDNAALSAACRSADRGVVGVFLMAADQWREHDWSGVRVRLVLRTLTILRQSLEALGIPLIVARADRFIDAAKVLLKIAKENECDSLFLNREYEVNEARRDEAVTRAFEERRLSVHAFHDQVVVAPGELRTGDGKFYTVFTPFKRAWMTRVHADGGVSAIAKPKKQERVTVAPTEIPLSVTGFETSVPDDLWPAGESEAHKRLRKFVATRIRSYKGERDCPSAEGTSTLSPYLAIGAISPRQCVVAAAEANDGKLDAGAEGPMTWISEVVWREFYRHVLVGFPRVCMNRAFKPEADSVPWRYDERDFDAWKTGRTGVPIVDAAMRQLEKTGWMHNRLRMVVAMYLTKDMFIDWRWGEKHFMQRLVDGDFASNNGGWQWSASTGTDAAPYFRIFNPISQSRTHDPRGTFIREHVPELAKLSDDDIHDPPPLMRAGLGYPQAVVDHDEARARVLKAFKKS